MNKIVHLIHALPSLKFVHTPATLLLGERDTRYQLCGSVGETWGRTDGYENPLTQRVSNPGAFSPSYPSISIIPW